MESRYWYLLDNFIFQESFNWPKQLILYFSWAGMGILRLRLPAFSRPYYMNSIFEKTKFNCAPFWNTIFPFNWIGSNWVYLSCVPCTVSKKLLTLLAVICLTSIATWGTNIGTPCLKSPEVRSIYFFSLIANILFFFISLLFLLNMKSFSIPMTFSKNVPDHSSYNQHSQCILGWLELTKSTYILKMFSLMGNSLMGQEYC